MSDEEEAKFGNLSLCLHQAVLREADVVCTTLGNSGDKRIKNARLAFACLVIDEAANAWEPDVIFAIVNSNPRKLILAGDPIQLPPFTDNEDEQLKLSMLVRLIRSWL